MRNASNEFKQILKDGMQSIVNYFDITLSDSTVLHIGPDRVKAGSVTITEASTSGDYFELGSAVGKILTFSIINHDDLYSAYDFYNAKVIAYDALTLSNNTVEKIRHGHYTITVPESPGSTISISAIDSIYKFDRPYAANTTYPATLLNILTDCCLDCGVSIGFSHFDNYNFTVLNKPSDCTYRQVVSWVGQIAGMNARMNDLDALEMVFYNFDASYMEDNAWGGKFDGNTPYATGDNLWGGNFDDWTSGDNVNGGNFDNWIGPLSKSKDVIVSVDNIVITGITIKNGDNETSVGNSFYQITITDNQLTVGKENEILSYLRGKIVGLFYRPYSLKEKSNPLFTTNDIVKFSDVKGNVFSSIINYLVYKPGGYSRLSAKAENPIRNASIYTSESARAHALSKQYAEEKLSNYDKQVEAMNRLAANAMGFHTNYEYAVDGSKITYMSDKPTVAESRIVYKETIDGFFLSQDGGKTYVYGYDSNGNVIVNILSAVGIICDWIKGGTLTLGGNNDINGRLEIYDENNNLIGKWGKDGVSVYKGEINGNKITVGGIDNISGYIEVLDNNGVSSARIGGPFGMSIDKARIAGMYFGMDAEYPLGASTSSAIISGTSTDSKRCKILRGDIYGEVEQGLFWKNVFTLGYSPTLNEPSLTMNNIALGTQLMLTPDRFYLNDGKIWAHDLQISPSGTKSKIASTKNYGDRLFYCYETPSPYFGDVGEGQLDSTGACYVQIDEIFRETINTVCNYQVFLQPYGEGSVWIEERNFNHFIAKGTPNMRFSWEIKAKQTGFEYKRLDRFKWEEKEPFTDYLSEAINYVTNFYKELENYE